MSDENLPHPLNQLDKNFLVQRLLASNETLFNQDSPTAGLYYLSFGAIDLKRTTSSGHNVMIHRVRAGDTFAEASLFTDSYHCTATASCKSMVIECQRSAITSLFDTDIEFSRTMIERLAVQLQESRRHVELLSIRAADQRILAALNDGLLIDDITTFAEIIGIAPETAYRTLARLSQNGEIHKTARGQYRLNTEE